LFLLPLDLLNDDLDQLVFFVENSASFLSCHTDQVMNITSEFSLDLLGFCSLELADCHHDLRETSIQGMT
jgi:hypothetical protein